MEESKPDMADGGGPARGDFWPCLALVLSVAGFFAGILFSREALLPSPLPDLTDKFLLMRSWTSRELLGGTLPHWNPHIFCGMPFRTETAVYYPLNAIFLFISSARALTISIVGHLALAGIFFYLFIRKLGARRFSSFASALVYIFCAQQILRVYAGHLPITLSAAWIPLLFFFVERYFRFRRPRDIAGGAIVFAAQIFSDNTQIVFYTSAAVLLYAFFRAFYLFRDTGNARAAIGRVVVITGLLGLGLGLSAVQIIPEAELARHSVRGVGSYDFASSFSFPPENLLTFLAPGIMGDGIITPYWGRYYLWEMTAYIGILPLLAALFAMTRVRNRYCLIFTISAFLTLLVAMGKYTPVYSLLFRYLPGFSMLRGHCKLLLLTSFFLAGLSAFGLDEALFAKPGRYRRLFRNVLIISAGMAVMIAVIFRSGPAGHFWRDTVLNQAAAQEREFNLPPDPDNETVVRDTLAAAGRSGRKFTGLLLASALIFFSRRAGKIRPPTAAGLVLAVILFDLWSFGSPYSIPAPVPKEPWPGEVVDFLKSDPEPFRVFTSEGVLANPGLAHGISNIAGHHENRLRRYMEFLHFSQGRKNLDELLPGRLVFDHLRFSPMFHLLNVKYILLPAAVKINSENYPLQLETARMRVYLNRGYLPRCYVVNKAVLIRDRDLILPALLSPRFDARRRVILEEESAPLPPAGGSGPEDRARVKSYSSNRVVVSAALTGGGYLILADTYYPGWKAFVDGREAEIYRANYVQRAVYLEPGEHTVEFVYSPLSFRIGAGISLAALAGVMMLITIARRGGKGEI